MFLLILRAALVFAFVVNTLPVTSLPVLDSLFPSSFSGWSRMGKVEEFNPVSIFDYMDGQAEIYVAYKMRRLLASNYLRAGQEKIEVELYDMGSSAEAYGVFSYGFRIGEKHKIGQGARYAYGSLALWQGPFFAKLTALKETPESKAFLLKLAQHLAENITVKGEKPLILEMLPKKGLDLGSVRYLHGQVWLNRLEYISDENILNLSKNTDVAYGEYPIAGQRAKVIIVKYPDAQTRERALRSVNQSYFGQPEPLKSGMQIKCIKPKEYLGVKKSEKGNFIFLCFKAPDFRTCQDLLSRVVQTSLKFKNQNDRKASP